MSNHTLKITLKSDLCAGSGYAFNGLIDSDVCYDEYGIPYIPGRRLKGCFKETADMLNKSCEDFISKEEIEQLFGRSGDFRQGAVTVDNAYIESYEGLRSDLKDFISGYDFISPQKILEQFTSIKAQTKLDNDGIADDNTLRYTRTVNHFKIDDSSQELAFYANVSVNIEDKSLFDKLAMLVEATRNIGMDRNRGLGSVECCFDDKADLQERKEALKADLSKISQLKPDDKVIISYSVVNKAPLMLSMDNDEVSENYIPGRNVLGALAGLYLSGDKGAAYENKNEKKYKKEFADLFLNGTTEYSNLYISKDDKEYYPAPLFVNKLKKTGKYVNVAMTPEKFDNSMTEDGLNPGKIIGIKADGEKVEMSGNMPKKLKGKYLYIADDNTIPKSAETEPEMHIDFHHTKKSKKKDLNGKVKSNLLYSNLVIKENQTFRGSIITTKKYAETIASLLDNTLRFGKSKSAQYGKCEVQQGVTAEPYDVEKKTIFCKKGQKLLVSFISDAIFTNDKDYTVNYEDIYKAVAKKLGISYKNKKPAPTTDDNDRSFSLISTKMIFGYNTVWNLRTAPVPAIEAGSTLVFEIAEDCNVFDNKNIGVRNLEGYGRVKLFKDIGYDMNPTEKGGDNEKTPEPEKPQISWEDKSVKSEIIRRIVTDEIINRCTEDVSDTDVNTASQLGRITLMLKQSKSYKDFIKRIKSIKKDADAIKGFLSRKICKNTTDAGLADIEYDTAIKDQAIEAVIRAVDLTDEDKTEFKRRFLKEKEKDGNWKQILMTYLSKIKYEKKLNDDGEGGE